MKRKWTHFPFASHQFLSTVSPGKLFCDGKRRIEWKNKERQNENETELEDYGAYHHHIRIFIQFNLFPLVGLWWKCLRAKLKRNGYIETFVVYAFTIIKLLRAQFNLHISFYYLPFASNSNPPAYVGCCGIPLLPVPFAKHVGWQTAIRIPRCPISSASGKEEAPLKNHTPWTHYML